MSISKKSMCVAALSGLLAITSIVPAQAQSVQFGIGQRDRVIQTYCDRNPNDRDCGGFYDRRWSDRDYDRFYNSRRSNLDNIASGIFGFTFGAIVGGAIANSQNNNNSNVQYYSNDRAHIAACQDRYRSYDVRTDTFLGYDGIRHRCNL
jgi:hypothetical protein